MGEPAMRLPHKPEAGSPCLARRSAVWQRNRARGRKASPITRTSSRRKSRTATPTGWSGHSAGRR